MKCIVVTILLSFGGCSLPQENNFRSPTHNYADVVDVEAISDCLMIDQVYGYNKRSGILAPTGEIIALKVVKAKAYERGGTHVTLEQPVSTEKATYIKGQVYDCTKKAKSESLEELALDNPEELDLLED